MKIFRCAAMGAALILTASTLAPAHAAPAGHDSPSQLVLSAKDVSKLMGTGYEQAPGAPITAKSLAVSEETSPGTFVKHGFQSGFASSFSKTKNLTSVKDGKLTIKPGISAVSSSINAFKNSSGPAWAFSLDRSHTKTTQGISLKITKLSGLGDEAMVVTSVTKLGGPAQSLVTQKVEWRHGAYLASVAVSGYGKINQSVVVNASKLMDAGIRTKG